VVSEFFSSQAAAEQNECWVVVQFENSDQFSCFSNQTVFPQAQAHETKAFQTAPLPNVAKS